MTTSIATMRSALADALETLAGWTVSPYFVDAVTTPMLVVGAVSMSYDVTMGRGADEPTITVTAYVSRSAEDAQQAKLDELLEPSGASSLKAAVEQQSVYTSAGVHYFRVRSATSVDSQKVGAAPYLFVDFLIEAVL
jgi:DNA-binding LytR/AlgR family response regulator